MASFFLAASYIIALELANDQPEIKTFEDFVFNEVNAEQPLITLMICQCDVGD